MAAVIENEVVFPRSVRDLFPAAAQQLYIETYRQSWAKSMEGNSNQLSHGGVASRDAWDAVKREFMQDPVTHKWSPIGNQATQAGAPTVKRSVLSALKSLFKR